MPGRGIRLNWNAAILVVLVWISQCLVPWESYAARFYGLNSSGDVRVINSSTGEIIAGLNTDLWSSGSIAFGPNGNLYGLNSSGHIRVHDPLTGSLIDSFNDVDLWSSGSIAFIPEPSTGLLLATGILGLALRRRSH